MDILGIFVQAFIGGGFFIIVLAPAFKIFKKAGVRSWFSLIPGVNVANFIKICGQPVAFAGLVSFIAFPAFWLLYDLLTVPGVNPDWAALIVVPLVILTASALLFCFPLLSAVMLFAVTVRLAVSPRPEGLVLALTIVIIVLAALQAIWDFLCWRALLKKFHRPFWQMIFIFLPLLAAFSEALISLIFGPVGVPLLLGTMLPVLFIGFVYYYFLGYSPKVQYRT